MVSRPRRLSVLAEAYSLLRTAAGPLAFVSLLINVVGAAANAAMLAIAGKILGLLAEGTTWEAAVPWLIAAAIAAAVDMVTGSIHQDLVGLAAEHIESHAVDRVLTAAARVPFASYDTNAFYDRLRRAHEGGSDHAWSIVQSTLNLTGTVLDMAGIVIVLAFFAPVLIAIGMLAYIPLWIVAKLNNRARYSFSWDQTETDRRRHYIETLLSERQPAKEVRSYGLEDGLLSQYRSLWKERLTHLAGVVKGTAIRSAFGYLGTSFVMTGALSVVVWLTIRGDLNLEQAGIGVLGVRQLSNYVTRTSRDIASLHGSGQFLSDYHRFRVEAAELADDTDGEAAPHRVDQVELHNVSFTYPGATTPALRDVDLTIHSGEVTAVVGANGSGKTTMLMLLAGLYQPSSGAITWDGQDLDTYSRDARARVSATLFQDFVQYHFTVLENLTLDEPDLEAAEEALRLAGVSDYRARLDHDLDTQLGKDFEDGTELSIGQWQRLALARALYRDSPFLLLDEPASALDPGAEAQLVSRLKSRFSDRCVVMISHRFASVRNADKILVFDEGRLIEQGTHDQLVQLSGAYSALYRAQADPLLGKITEDQ